MDENMKIKRNPNWLEDNDWSDKRRLDWLKQIMVFSSRDWSTHINTDPGYPDLKSWSMWCLVCCNTKEDAIRSWIGFCDDYDDKY